ncbi:hypothetical protein B7463_g3304, partial [Scytalidium lignicola]
MESSGPQTPAEQEHQRHGDCDAPENPELGAHRHGRLRRAIRSPRVHRDELRAENGSNRRGWQEHHGQHRQSLHDVAVLPYHLAILNASQIECLWTVVWWNGTFRGDGARHSASPARAPRRAAPSRRVRGGRIRDLPGALVDKLVPGLEGHVNQEMIDRGPEGRQWLEAKERHLVPAVGGGRGAFQHQAGPEPLGVVVFWSRQGPEEMDPRGGWVTAAAAREIDEGCLAARNYNASTTIRRRAQCIMIDEVDELDGSPFPGSPGFWPGTGVLELFLGSSTSGCEVVACLDAIERRDKEHRDPTPWLAPGAESRPRGGDKEPPSLQIVASTLDSGPQGFTQAFPLNYTNLANGTTQYAPAHLRRRDNQEQGHRGPAWTELAHSRGEAIGEDQPNTHASPGPACHEQTVDMATNIAHDGDEMPADIANFNDAHGWYRAAVNRDRLPSWRWKRPRLYYPAKLQYNPVDKYAAVDGMGRTKDGTEMFECTLNPASGKFELLCVQTRDSFCTLENSTWDRTIIRNSAPRLLRLATFPFHGIHWSKRSKPKEWDGKDWQSFAWRWVLGSLGITFFVFIPSPSRPEGKDPRAYLPFRYNGYRYPRLARNHRENRREISQKRLRDPSWITDGATPSYRAFRPRYLCYLIPKTVKGPDGKEKKTPGYETRPVGRDDHTPYVFISYTKAQFCVVKGNDQDKKAMTENNYAQLCAQAVDAVQDYATSVKDDYKKPRAFWLDHLCMPLSKYDETEKCEREVTDPDEIKELTDDDVYTMSDVIREAETTIVIVRDRENKDANDANDALVEWGERAWTLTEVLLSKSTTVMLVENRNEPVAVPKVQLAERAWKDAGASRQLVEHFTNLPLSRLELVTIALACLKVRKLAGSGHRRHLAYILMGLLRIRPPIDSSDSAFQAFARLSLPQDSDRLMERLICLLPKDLDEPWEKMSDQYDSSLWDIYPDVQICGVGENDTVVVDGCKGAMIQWSSFQDVQFVNRMTLLRRLILYSVAFSPMFLFLGIVFLGVGGGLPGSSNPMLGVGGFFFGLALLIMFSAPWHLPRLFSGKFHEVEPCLFGIEGYVPLAVIEEKLFGLRMERLKWGPYGSPLSRHTHRECYRELKEDVVVDVESGDDVPLLNANGVVENGEVWTYPVEAVDPCSPCPNCRTVNGSNNINGNNNNHENSTSNEGSCNPEHLTFSQADSKSRSDFGSMKVFTLIDTCSMTATLFYACRPPVALIIGGSEGGMKRALACSYDVTTGTMYRETVLRVPTQTVDAMHSLPRVRLGLKNPHKSNTAKPVTSVIRTRPSVTRYK